MIDKSVVVSVIMPVYNPGQYLHTAIMGILEQSYENFELICIDDASTDGSNVVLIQYQKSDKRIRLIHHDKNIGAAYTRNEGIALAEGKYIFFVDADDVFEKDLLKYMVYVAEQKPVDMVYINYNMFENEKSYSTDIRGDYYYFGKFFSAFDEKNKCPKELLRLIPLAPYSRLYTADFIKKNKLWFQNIKSSNDVYFGIMATALSQKIAFLEEQINLVHVRIHEGRYRISNMRNPHDNFQAYNYLKQEMERLGLPNEEIEIVQERFLNNILQELNECDSEQKEKFYQFICAEGLERMEVLKEKVNLDSVYSVIAEFFHTKSLESKWFENISLFGYRIKKWKIKIINLFKQIEEQGKTCGIWGAGRDGALLAGLCAENHCQCKGFIDNDKEKWGKKLFNYNVFSPVELLEIVDTVIVINQKYFNDIYDQINAARSGIEMVSLSMYLQFEQDLYSSTIIVADY